MKVFIVAIPFFDSAMVVSGYQLCSRNAESVLDISRGHSRMAEALLSPGLDLVEKVGVEPFAGDCPLFVGINRFQLLTGEPTNRNIPPEKLVCVIPGGLAAEEDVLARCETLRNRGYTLALDEFPLNGVDSPFFKYVDYLLLNYENPRFSDCLKAVSSRHRKVHIIVSQVPDMETFQRLGKTRRGTLYTGNFYSQPITAGISEISPVKMNALQLMNLANDPASDLSEMAKVIERDPALSISLLRFINSSGNLNRKISSIQQAVTILGQDEVRHWATVAISTSLGDDRPGELTKLSLVRAKFAENLAGLFELGVFQQSLFMAGLFSLLDVILQKPMKEAMEEVAVDQRVYEALVEHTGNLYPVMELIYTYEHADWDKVSRIAVQNNLDIQALNRAFVDALIWYEQLLSSLDGPAA